MPRRGRRRSSSWSGLVRPGHHGEELRDHHPPPGRTAVGIRDDGRRTPPSPGGRPGDAPSTRFHPTACLAVRQSEDRRSTGAQSIPPRSARSSSIRHPRATRASRSTTRPGGPSSSSTAAAPPSGSWPTIDVDRPLDGSASRGRRIDSYYEYLPGLPLFGDGECEKMEGLAGRSASISLTRQPRASGLGSRPGDGKAHGEPVRGAGFSSRCSGARRRSAPGRASSGIVYRMRMLTAWSPRSSIIGPCGWFNPVTRCGPRS